LFVHKVFSFRRKTLRKAIDMAGYVVPLAELGIEETIRAESLSPGTFWRMYEARVKS